MYKNKGIIYLQELKKGDSENSYLQFLSNYPKFKSVYTMALAGLPVSKSVIAIGSSERTKKELENIIKEWKVDDFTIRSEKQGGTVSSKSIQGCKIEDVWTGVENFLKQDLLPMVISQGDVYHNTYSINIKVDPGKKTNFYLEIVGPGFCATDINKRDIVNERGTLISDGHLEEDRIVNQESYIQQVEVMKKNVAKKEIEKGKVFNNSEEEKQWVESYLKKIDALILKHTSYEKIREKYLQKIVDFIPGIIKAGEIMDYAKEPYIVSMSFVLEKGRENIYFWDIYPYFGYRKN